MTEDLSSIKLYSQTNFANVSSTDDDKLYFVEDNTQAYITETYHNGSSWYRVWSDGFIEQGGIKNGTTGNNSTQISLNKTMTTTTYIALVHYNYTAAVTSSSNTSGQACNRWNGSVVSKSTTYFNCQTGNGYNYAWYVCGY